MQAKLSEQISSTDAEIILRRLPDWIQDALIARATEIDYPVEAILFSISFSVYNYYYGMQLFPDNHCLLCW